MKSLNHTEKKTYWGLLLNPACTSGRHESQRLFCLGESAGPLLFTGRNTATKWLKNYQRMMSYAGHSPWEEHQMRPVKVDINL